jgi:hypothetical protein
MVLGVRNQLSEQLFQDMTDLARQSAKDRIKPTYDINLARHTLLSDAEIDSLTSQPSGAKKAPAP